ncbi:MAG: hypothetical protein IJ457_06140 [Clostridia bacterium]|nr:hypothetical protein [Clostridia bacterium]
METSSIANGIGKLMVKVTGGNGAYPIEGAYVYIREYEGDLQLLYSLRSDINGNTPLITLPTPPASESLFPNGKKPYSEYIITVKKDGYYTNENIGVPVFDGITSIQRADLLPLTEEDLLSDTVPEAEYYETDGYTSLRGVTNIARDGGNI